MVEEFMYKLIAIDMDGTLLHNHGTLSKEGMDVLANYTMPIFLMHTMLAASMRAVLLKLGIGSSVIHVVLGLGISFVGPIVAAWIMKKTKWLEFFLYLNKFVKIRNYQKV